MHLYHVYPNFSGIIPKVQFVFACENRKILIRISSAGWWNFGLFSFLQDEIAQIPQIIWLRSLAKSAKQRWRAKQLDCRGFVCK
jgi:hypothetical protein